MPGWKIGRTISTPRLSTIRRRLRGTPRIRQFETTWAFATRAAHGEPVAHYNLGYLLTQKKNNTAAMIHFQKAAEQDPNMGAAKEWIAKLSTPASPYASQAGGSMVAGPQAA